MEAIRVLIVDDHPFVRRGLRVYLSRLPELICVGEAQSGREALAQVALLQPDVVLMDLDMPVMSGFDAIAALRAAVPQLPIIALAELLDAAQLRHALQCGAKGYVDKSISARELGQAIETVYHEQTYLAQAAVFCLVQEELPDVGARLTTREREVLALLAGGRAYNEIARDLCISDRTVKSHVYKLRQKIGSRNRTEAALFAFRTGIVGSSSTRFRL